MLSCTFSLLNLPLMSQCLTQQTEFEWPCLWMVGRSRMTDHPVWTQLWSFFSLSPLKIDHDCGFYFMFLADTHRINDSATHFMWTCKNFFAFAGAGEPLNSSRSGMGAAGDTLQETDYCCYVECFPCSRVSRTRSLKGAADILGAQHHTREKPFNWQENVSGWGFSVFLWNNEPIKVCVLHEGIQTVIGSGVKRYDLIITQINSKTMHVLLQ